MEIYVKGSIIHEHRDFFLKGSKVSSSIFDKNVDYDFRLEDRNYDYGKSEYVTKKITPSKETLDGLYRIQLDRLQTKTLLALMSFFLTLKDIRSKNIVDKIKMWLANIKNPLKAKVNNLRSLEKLLIKAVKESKQKYLYRQMEGDFFIPYIVKDIKYKSRDKDDDLTRLIINLCCEEFPKLEKGDDDDNYSWRRSSTVKGASEIDVTIYSDDIFEIASTSIEVDEDEDETTEEEPDEDNDDDDEDQPKRKKKKGEKVPGVSVMKILQNRNLFPESDELNETYEKHLEIRRGIYRKIGKQYLGSNFGRSISNRYWYEYSNKVPLEENGIKHKLVVDTPEDTVSNNITIKTDQFGELALPTPPYIMMYDLDSHRNILVHVENLEEYVYDEKIKDQLVLDAEDLDMLDVIVANDESVKFQDVINGKGSGIIVLCSGIPGIGKTLTAEIYSELVSRPLYKVNSSQLGDDPQKLENRLGVILKRASRWNALLLIDEADTYIRMRGDDLTQNLIVGTFLRLLEYYKGVLFFTTNLSGIIDDAIISRTSIWVKYKRPTIDQLEQIWQIIAKRNYLNLPASNCKKIVKEYPNLVGRDVANAVKLLKKVYKEKEIELEDFVRISKYFSFQENLKPIQIENKP